MTIRVKLFLGDLFSTTTIPDSVIVYPLVRSATRERIRQIEAKALRKLRHPSRAKKLKSFVE